MAFSVPRRGLSNRFGEKLWKLTHLHKDRLHDRFDLGSISNRHQPFWPSSQLVRQQTLCSAAINRS
jgi:hypothetical protein